MSVWSHFGLFFGEAERDQALAQREEAPLVAAWPALARPPATGTPSLPEARDSLHALALWGGFRFRWAGDEEAAARARAIVRDLVAGESAGEYHADAGALLAQAQCLELLRPFLREELAPLQGAWRQAWQQLPRAWEYDEQAWARLLQGVAGVLLEEAGHLEAAMTAHREAIERDLHPEGYWRPVVGEEMGAAPAGSFRRQLRATQAYALLAEVVEQAQRNKRGQGFAPLWSFHKRHVSIRTAIAYCAYYYFYPEHWRWEAQPLRETASLFRQYGAFLELALRRVPTRPLPLLLRELRPLFGVYGGGWTTLTHGAASKRGTASRDWRRWLDRWRQRLLVKG
ncbi:MAG: hypothetical protein OXG02_06155 [Chloroflexi bacterium]|nr:hypothetical protein [Chloroflexota bacterium]